MFYCFCSYSYSEIKNDTTKNAAGTGLNWVMQNILPGISGLTVDGVIYQYSTIKNQQDPMTVTIQNKDAMGTGYIFRNQDDWTGLKGTTITRVIPVDNIPGNRWGDGEISIVGKGSVSDASVFYKYRYDTCVNPLSSPSCPGYAEAMLKSLTLKNVEISDPLTEEMRKSMNESKALCSPNQSSCSTKENKKRGEEYSKKNKEDDKKKTIINSLLSPKDNEVALQFEKMNDLPGLVLYSVSLPGGIYKDSLRYSDKILPDNRRARSLGLAQERMHESMVNSQYDR